MTEPVDPAPQRITLADHVRLDPERARPVPIVNRTGLKVLHLSLAPGQSVPRHNHAGRHVILQGLMGTVTVRFDDDATSLDPGQILYVSGERFLSPGNDGEGPAALLITLASWPD